MYIKLAYAALLSVSAVLGGCAANPIRTGNLLHEMTDMRRLAEAPLPGYQTVQYSSYDRSSNLPDGPGWFNNSDGFGGEKIPNFEGVLREPDEQGVGEYLICDVRGPGAIVRTWTAAIGGKIRLFLDDARQPLYDGPAEDFLLSPYQAIQTASGYRQLAPSEGFRQFQAAYCPIPFAKRCRMIWIGKLNEVHFYQVQIRHYARGTAVRTFQPADLDAFAKEIMETARVLADPHRNFVFADSGMILPINATLPPGNEIEVLKIDGPKALHRLSLKLEAQQLDHALRQTLVQVICDDAPHGQVQAPVGAFFGAAPGINPFNSLPFTVEPDGTMTCRYVMPFEKSLRLVLANRGDQPVVVNGAAWAEDYRWTENSMHFHARWRVDHGLFASPRAVQDMPYVIVHGRGRYVGTALMLLNPCRIPTPYGGWWGEGDEKVFVDGDFLPSTFGTGSEDYFNYAWSVPDIFGYAYCGQPRNDGPGNRGFVTNQRWHILDDLPFQQRLAFFMELYPHTNVPELSYARIGYYYAHPGSIDDHLAITDEDLRELRLPLNWEPASGYGMHGAVYHQLETLAPTLPNTTMTEGDLWAGGKLAAWQPTALGDELTLTFTLQESRKYRLHLSCLLDERSGRFSARIDGLPVNFESWGPVVDLCVPHRVLARQYTLENREYTAGAHTLSIVFEGAHEPNASPRIGLDYLAIQPG